MSETAEALSALVADLRDEAESCEETVRKLPDQGRWARERDYYRGYAFALRQAADRIEETP